VPATDEPRKILVVRPRAAGDVLLATPILRALRERFPSAWISFAVRRNMTPLVAENPHANEILVMDAHEDRAIPLARRLAMRARFYALLRSAHFDWAIDLHGGPRSAFVVFASGARRRVGYDTRGRRYAYTHRVPRFELNGDDKPVVRRAVRINAAMIEPLGVSVRDEALVLRVPEVSRERARLFAESQNLGASGRPLVLVNAAAKWPTKAWAAERYATLAGRLAREHGADVLIMWGPGEKAVAESVRQSAGHERVRLAPGGDLGDAAALVARADLVAGTDSGISHMAAALGTPSVTLFGPTNPGEWHGYDSARHVAIWHDVPCSFCNLTRCAWHACMKELTVERVLDACAAQLARFAGTAGAGAAGRGRGHAA
jgi:lipopolysaccharide heptosyltransferase II